MRTLAAAKKGALAAALLFCALRARAAPLDEARQTLRSGKTAQAVVELKKILEKSPEDLEVRCALGQALAWRKEYGESESQYQLILSKKPEHREALLGMARLLGYQARYDEALSTVGRGLAASPADPEFLGEKERLEGLRGRGEWGREFRYTARAGYSHEAYSLAGPGNGLGLSLQDRSFHGWNAGAGLSHEHRFRLDDLDLGISASRKLSWRRAYAGFSLGGATRHVLLPAFRAALQGGIPLGGGLVPEGEVSYRHYDDANVYSFRISPFFYWRRLTLTPAYSLSRTYYTDGGRSGALSSYRVKLEASLGRRLRPWAAYAHTKEPFEAGSRARVSNFGADHYSFGSALSLSPRWEANAWFERESRDRVGQHVNRAGLGASYSWGDLK